jgi:hypothetical protein
MELEETRLPGIGSKFVLPVESGGRLTVILHNDGKRELYWFRRRGDEDPSAVITLDDDEARQLGAVLGVAILVAVLGEGSFDGAWLLMVIAAALGATAALGIGEVHQHAPALAESPA